MLEAQSDQLQMWDGKNSTISVGVQIFLVVFCAAPAVAQTAGFPLLHSARAAVIIGNPEILPGKNGDSPRVQKLSVCGSGYAGSIGDQIGLEIAGLLGVQHRSTSQCHEQPE